MDNQKIQIPHERERIPCDFCGELVPKPEPHETSQCQCGQGMFNNPNGRFGPYIGGIYKSCVVCRKLITCHVSYSQHYHDECRSAMREGGLPSGHD